MWIVCVGCHHVAEIKRLKKTAKLKCSICGSGVARTVRRVKLDMLNGGQLDGPLARMQTYAGLLSIARARGYKLGWANVKYKIIFGEQPGLKGEQTDPSSMLLWWIRKETIAYARKHFPREKDKKPESPKYQSDLMSEEDWGAL